MSVLRPRNRLVNFRLSEDEFEMLRESCGRFGARSISDFARSSVLARLEEDPEAKTRLSSLDNKVVELETRVSQLLKLVDATGTSAQTSLFGMARAVETANVRTAVP